MITEERTSIHEDHIDDSVWSDLVQKVPVLTDKMLVDLVNGLEVSDEQIRVRRQRQGIPTRIWDGLIGTSSLRQQLIDGNLQTGLQVAAIWLQNLQNQQLKTELGIEKVAEKLTQTREVIKRLGRGHMELKREVERLEYELGEKVTQLNKQQTELREEVERIGMQQSAKSHLDRIFDAWEAGRYDSFAPLTQLAVVLEELYWSPFGRYDRINPEFREQARHKCVIQMRRITDIRAKELLLTEELILSVGAEKKAHREMIVYLFETDEHSADILPINRAMTGIASQESDEQDRSVWLSLNRSHNLPYVFEPNRLSERMMEETIIRLSNEEKTRW